MKKKIDFKADEEMCYVLDAIASKNNLKRGQLIRQLIRENIRYQNFLSILEEVAISDIRKGENIDEAKKLLCLSMHEHVK